MDTRLEKDVSAVALKAAGLHHRAQTVLAMADLLNEYVQLAAAQQKQIAALVLILRGYEDKSVNPASEAVHGKT